MKPFGSLVGVGSIVCATWFFAPLSGVLASGVQPGGSASNQRGVVAERREVSAPAWRLAGILRGPNFQRAVFARLGETRTLAEDGDLDGWTVTDIGPRSVTLAAAGQSVTLDLEGMTLEEQVAAARERAEQAAKIDAAVVAASRQHDRERDAAMNLLSDATRRMTGH